MCRCVCLCLEAASGWWEGVGLVINACARVCLCKCVCKCVFVYVLHLLQYIQTDHPVPVRSRQGSIVGLPCGRLIQLQSGVIATEKQREESGLGSHGGAVSACGAHTHTHTHTRLCLTAPRVRYPHCDEPSSDFTPLLTAEGVCKRVGSHGRST